MERLGDLAERAAQKLQDEQLAMIEAGDITLDEGEAMRREQSKGIFAKIDFHWRTSDRMILDQIRAAADNMFAEQFDSALQVLDEFYASLRAPQVNAHGVVVTGADRRPLWQTNDEGNPVEDWNRLTGQDIEEALFKLQQIRLLVAPQVDELRSEAIYAKHLYDDQYQDGYRGLIEGTQGDRNAYASKVSRTDKYHSFFRYYVYSRSWTFWQELNAFIRLLERVRDWRTREQRR